VTPEFLVTTLIVVASPGAGVLYTVAAGISRNVDVKKVERQRIYSNRYIALRRSSCGLAGQGVDSAYRTT
jgi:hypothetical protein